MTNPRRGNARNGRAASARFVSLTAREQAWQGSGSGSIWILFFCPRRSLGTDSMVVASRDLPSGGREACAIISPLYISSLIPAQINRLRALTVAESSTIAVSLSASARRAGQQLVASTSRQRVPALRENPVSVVFLLVSPSCQISKGWRLRPSDARSSPFSDHLTAAVAHALKHLHVPANYSCKRHSLARTPDTRNDLPVDH